MKKILFVCTGNTCRSPMAMYIFIKMAASQNDRFDYEAASAGLAVSAVSPPSENAVLAVRELFGIDISLHRSRQISREDVEGAYLILTMTLSHKNYILSLFPNAYQKVYTLKEYSYGTGSSAGSTKNASAEIRDMDVADPYGENLLTYKLSAGEIADAVGNLFKKIKNS